MTGGGTKRAANEVRWIDHADDLLAAIFRAGRQLQHAFDDIGDKDRFLTLPHQGFPGGKVPAAADGIQRLNLILVESGADSAVPDDAQIATGHGFSH